jgi:PAS domain S-box-containing protein
VFSVAALGLAAAALGQRLPQAAVGALLVAGAGGGLWLGVLARRRDAAIERELASARQDAERAVRIFESSGIGTFETDFATRRVRYSPRACELLGIPLGSEATLGESYDNAPREDRDRLRAAFLAALDPRGDGRFEEETQIQRAGEERYIAYRGRVEFRETPAGPTPWRALGALLDVTDRRRAEGALRESEQRWRLAFEANAIGSFAVHVPSRRVDASPELRRLLGIPETGPHDIAQALALIRPEDVAELRKRFAHASAPGADGRVRLDLRLARDDRWLAFSAQAEFRDTPDGRRPVRVLGVALDITERKRFEATLRDGEALFRAFVNNSAVVAWLKDSTGHYRFVSENYERRFGLAPGSALRKTDFEIWPREVAEELVRNDAQVLERQETFEVVEEMVAANGERSWWHSAKLPFQSSDGARYVAGLAVEITAERKAQEQIREADRRKDEFIAILAHELRSPLAPLRNVAKLLDADAGADLHYCSAVMTRQVDQMSRLLDDLLDASRIPLGKLTFRRQRIELARVVEGALEATQPLLDASGRQLEVRVPATPVWLDGDLTRLIQVLTNLIANAVRYSDPGSTIELNAERAGSRVVIGVKDEGVGIAPEDLPKVDEMFGSAHASRSAATGGLGIGLALARGLTELHGGTLSGTSEGRGRGSEFRVTMPVAEPPEGVRQAASPAPSVPSRASTKFRVLVADDLIDGADSMAMVLRAAGHEVVTAYDGSEAFARAESFRPDVAVLDIGMPKLDGYEVCRRIRAQDWGRHLLLIALTGWGDAEERRRARDAGFDGFDDHLTKPVDPRRLQELIAAGPPSGGSAGA